MKHASSRRAAFLTSTALSAAPRSLKRATGVMAGVALTGLMYATPTLAQSVTVDGDVNPNPPGGAFNIVGVNAAGTVTVAGGATVTDQSARIGQWGKGTVIVTGARSSWISSENFSVGYRRGGGEVLIEDGGSVSGDVVHIGLTFNAQGMVTVTGAGSTVESRQLFVGTMGTGNMTIENGGSVTSGSAFIGTNDGSNSSVTVKGTSSTWTSGDSIYVGRLGTGTLTVEDGATISSGNAVFFGFETGSSGMGIVRGGDSTLTATEGVSVGFRGTGALTIEDGATVESERGFIGTDPSGNGMVTVTGNGSSWTASSLLRVGHAGSGVLTIEESGMVTTDQVTVGLGGGNGTLNLDGTVGARGVLETGRVVGGAGTGALNLNGGILRATANHAEFLSGFDAVNVANRGAYIDTNGHNIGVTSPLEGSGSLTKRGAGRLTLTGNNSYGGGTTIAAGTLQLGDGGTSGSIVGNVVNNGTFAFNRSNTLTLDGDISGSGGVRQIGAGDTVLTGSNSYAGATTVNAGGLFVNGDQSAATGATTVAGGATLGGTGTIGGNVTVADGGVLNPGELGNAPGTLTIAGNLDLAPNAVLNYAFGEAGVVGGALNDLTNVGGDLVLDGTLNITTSPGGSFDPGIYRVINYDGNLTANNGLELGTPTPNLSVQLAPGQVNLINTAGLTFRYWDGTSGGRNDSAVDGGDGVWQNFAGNDDYWTEETGTPNGAFTDNAFAVFMGAAGTVMVDERFGAVNASGMQFAVDGYRIEGDVLNLVGPRSVIRVGDGTTDGAEMTATIASELAGTSELVKSDLGTLVLEGDNSYSGGTSMTGGALQIAADSALGDAAGGLSFDGGTLRTTADIATDRSVTFDGEGAFETVNGTMLTLDGSISGPGIMNKDGTGTLLVTGDNGGYLADSKVAAGTLVVDGILGGNVDVASRGRLEGNGSVGGIVNAGVVGPGRSIGTLTVTGDYVGSDGTLEIETTLGDDSSPTDLLAVNGDTSGSTTVTVANRGGTGAQTVEGIKIIDVGGASNGTFTLDGDYVFEGEQAVVAGAYGYRLYKNGITDPVDGDWYLRSALLDPHDPDEPDTPIFQPGVPIYENYAGTLQQFNKLGTLQQRVGNRLWAAPADGASGSDARQKQPLDSSGVWARIEAAHAEFEPDVSTSGANYDVSTWKLQTGVDVMLLENEAGRFIGGIFAQYGTISSSISSPFGAGSIDTTGYGLGATLTWYGDNGFYADGQAQITWYDSDLHSDTAGRSLVTGNDGMGYGLSIEAGKRIALARNWSLTPQAQLAYSSVDFDDFTDAFGADVSLDKSRRLVSRFGVAVNHDTEWQAQDGTTSRAHLYGIANLYYDFGGESKVEVAGTAFESRNDRLYGGIGFGGSFNWADDKYSLYGEGQLNTSLENFGDSNAISGTVGFRVRW